MPCPACNYCVSYQRRKRKTKTQFHKRVNIVVPTASGWLKNTVTVLRRYPENMVGEVEAGCLAEEHVMYAGEDEAVLDNTDAPQKCCDACGTNPDCKYWVWSHSQRTCWLKRTKEYQTDMKGFLSGSKKGTTHQEL